MEYSVKITALAFALLCYAGQAVPTNQNRIRFELRLADSQPGKELTKVSVRNSDEIIYLHKEAIITNEDIAEVRVVRSDVGSGYDVRVDFTRKGAERISKATEENIGRKMAVILNGIVVTAPAIASKVSDRAVITGNFTEEKAAEIAKGIKGR